MISILAFGSTEYFCKFTCIHLILFSVESSIFTDADADAKWPPFFSGKKKCK